MSRLGHALTELSDPPVKALFVYNSNPAAVAPNQNAVVRGLMRSDLFTVAHEQFFTDTTDYADIVLPATTFLEHKDFQGAYGHYFLQLSEQAIAPLGEAKQNIWLFSQLAQRMGFSEACFQDGVDDLIDQALAGSALRGITRADLESQKRIQVRFAADLPFARPRQQSPVLFERACGTGNGCAADFPSAGRIAARGRRAYISAGVFAAQG